MTTNHPVSVTTLAREDSNRRTGCGGWLDLIHEVNRILPATFGNPEIGHVNEVYTETYPNATVSFPAGDTEVVTVEATTDLGAALIRQAALNLGLALDA